MAVSANDLVSEVRRRVRDTSTSNPVYTRTDVYDALRSAMRKARGAFWLEGVYSSLTGGTDGVYALPSYITRIQRIERSLFNASNIAPGLTPHNGYDTGWQELHDYEHIPSEQTNLLYMGKSWYMHNLRIHYERDLPVIPIEDTLATSLTAGALSIPLTNSGSPSYQWPVPGFIQVGNEIMGYSGVTATAFVGVSRAQYRTYAAIQASATLVSPVIQELEPDHKVVDYIVEKSIHELMLLRLQDGDTEGNKQVAALAAEWGRTSDETRRRYGQRHHDRVITWKRTLR